MRPRILYDLSRQLAILLERGLRGERGSPRIPVLVCHPLDALEGREGPGAGTLAVLYPTRIVQETRWRDRTFTVDGPRLGGDRVVGRGGVGGPAAPADLRERVRHPPLWVRARFAFLVLGGTVEDQLGAMTAALQTVHDHPTLSLGGPVGDGPAGERRAVGEAEAEEAEDRGAGAKEAGAKEAGGEAETDADGFPLRLVDDGEGWKDLGLKEHVLTISLEVTIPIASERTEIVERVVDREVRVEEAAP